MTNILNAQDAEMYGRNKIEKWRRQFEARWNEPETVMVQAQWAQIPDMYKEIMRGMMDADMLAIVEGGKNGNKLAY